MSEEEKNVLEDDASVLDENYDDSETSKDIEKEESAETPFPVLEPNESEEVVEQKNVQLSLDPTVQAEEEKQLAAEDNRKHLSAVLEGLLFLTGDDGLTLEQAASTLDVKKEEAESLFDDLQKYYTSDDRGFEIEKYGNTYRFLSKASIHEYAKKLFQMEKSNHLSNAALETLAIIAYKQPITRVEIEEIRGVGADVMLRKLEARGLIEESGRSEAPGRPFLYKVTDTFMDAFQLMSLDELPDLPEFNQDEEGREDLFQQ